MKNTVIKIDRDKCTGCGACVNRCHQSALQLIDGKAVLVGDDYCDGLGNCIGECPVGAITLEERKFRPTAPTACACPSSSVQRRQFPVQLHLVNPQAEHFRGADLLLAADCTAFTCADFHGKLLHGKMLAIACPKLDTGTQAYLDKLVEMIDGAQINSLTVLVMEVPCCQGLVRLAQAARDRAERNVPLRVITLSVGGEVLSENHF
jgi:ferredoxin